MSLKLSTKENDMDKYNHYMDFIADKVKVDSMCDDLDLLYGQRRKINKEIDVLKDQIKSFLKEMKEKQSNTKLSELTDRKV